MSDLLKNYLSPQQFAEFKSLVSPAKIQGFLDKTPYSAEYANRCLVSVMRDRQAHCLDGALFAAAALRQIGFPPVVVDMFPDPGMDDDHVLAIYKRNGLWGAVAKSNFVGLRLREAVYHTLRELVMSYFADFFNLHGVKTLRSYTRPFNLEKMDHEQWMWCDEGVDAVEQRLLKLKRFPLISREAAGELSLVDPLSYKAGMMVANEAGLYKPKS